MNVYEIITQKIIKELEKGTSPWHRPWAVGGLPRNFVTKKQYRGLNCFLLQLNEFQEPYYLTFNQVNKLNGSVKSGAESQLVIYWKWLESKTEVDAKGHPKLIPLLRYYRVFNIEQVTGIKFQSALKQLNEFEKITNCEQIIEGFKNRPGMSHTHQQAFYNPLEDLINMPIKESFKSKEEYYSTLFHEMVHSTGHSSRLNRSEVSTTSAFGSDNYSKEELIAEMGSAFICAQSGISVNTLANSAAYISFWLNKLKKDSRILFKAASQAQRGVDYMTNTPIEDNGQENN